MRCSSGSRLIRTIKLDGVGCTGVEANIQPEDMRMITPAYVCLMAQYNAEMNRRLYDAAGRLSDADRKADRGAFWKSIHGTLTHILWGDTQWMSRFDNWAKPDVAIKQSAGMIDDFDTLRARRIKADADIQSWAAKVDD